MFGKMKEKQVSVEGNCSGERLLTLLGKDPRVSAAFLFLFFFC